MTILRGTKALIHDGKKLNNIEIYVIDIVRMLYKIRGGLFINNRRSIHWIF